ncbi:MAG: hypothetical protein E6R05_03835 [Candidatus Moraniibacteriota bacterium]|nr:MAG: hypothetical protein E6R05_03835 [Candidatus Moranbacteria bacterium]
MTAGIAGSGPYSRLRDLRFQVRALAQEIRNKPMGPRTKQRKEAELRALRQQLKVINAEIRSKKLRPRDCSE